MTESGAPLSPADKTLLEEVLAGKTRAVARMMSRAEAGGEEDRRLLAELYRHTGRAHMVGLTGVPGSGKSTLAGAIARACRRKGLTIGIVAVDPSSPYSGGAILGDRIRMTGLTGDDGVFIRSMATGGVLGGLARASQDMMDILDAAGFDVVLVETVGVGQDEVDIMRAAHTVIVLSAPGLGDDIQAIKAGVLEIADIHAVSKGDRADAGQTAAQLKSMLNLNRTAKGNSTWRVPVLVTSATTGDGIEQLITVIGEHKDHLEQSGEMAERRKQILKFRIVKNMEDIISTRVVSEHPGMLTTMIGRVLDRKTDPHGAALDLLDALAKD